MSSDCVTNDFELSRLLLDQLADKWTILVLEVFCDGPEPVRFNEIKRRVQGISQKTLTQCLRRLERNGILKRTVIAAAPLGVECLGYSPWLDDRRAVRGAPGMGGEASAGCAASSGTVRCTCPKSRSVEPSEVA